MAKLTTDATDWEERVKRLLRAELARKGVKYPELSKYLARIGIEESAAAINTKINRGTFRAYFLIQCLTAIGCKKLDIEL